LIGELPLQEEKRKDTRLVFKARPHTDGGADHKVWRHLPRDPGEYPIGHTVVEVCTAFGRKTDLRHDDGTAWFAHRQPDRQ
jgi:hypothetical protein